MHVKLHFMKNCKGARWHIPVIFPFFFFFFFLRFQAKIRGFSLGLLSNQAGIGVNVYGGKVKIKM